MKNLAEAMNKIATKDSANIIWKQEDWGESAPLYSCFSYSCTPNDKTDSGEQIITINEAHEFAVLAMDNESCLKMLNAFLCAIVKGINFGVKKSENQWKIRMLSGKSYRQISIEMAVCYIYKNFKDTDKMLWNDENTRQCAAALHDILVNFFRRDCSDKDYDADVESNSRAYEEVIYERMKNQSKRLWIFCVGEAVAIEALKTVLPALGIKESRGSTY